MMGAYRASPTGTRVAFQTSYPVPPIQNEKTWRDAVDGADISNLQSVPTPYQQQVAQVQELVEYQPGFQRIITRSAPVQTRVAEDYSSFVAFPTPPTGSYTTSIVRARATVQSSLINNVVVESVAPSTPVVLKAPAPTRQVR